MLRFALIASAQDVPAWKGSKVISPGKYIDHPDGSTDVISATSISLELSVNQDGTWNIKYDSAQSSAEANTSNTSQKPLTLEFKNNTFDSAITITGAMLPDSTIINCVITKGDSITNLALQRVPAPVFWSGDTTFKSNKITIRVTYQNDQSWEIFLQGDFVGTNTIDASNEAQLPQIAFSLATTFDTSSSGRHIEGTMSPDSASIACKFFMNDSLSFPITLYKGKRNIEEHAAEVYSTSLWWWGGAWAIFAIIMFLLSWLSKKSATISPGTYPELPDKDWLKKIFPIVRVSCKKIFPRKRKVLVIHNDSLFIYHANKNTNIDALHDENSETVTGKLPGLKNVRQIPVASIERIEIQKESRLGKVCFRIYHKDKKESLALPGYEMPNVLKALHSLTGIRLQNGYPIRFHDPGPWIQLFVFSFAAIYIFTNLLQPGVGLITILYIILFIVVLLRIIFLVFATIPWFMDHLNRKFHVDKKTIVKADLSHRKPFRSVPLAIFLKIIGALVFILTFLVVKQKYLPSSFQDYLLVWGPYFLAISGLCGYLLAGLLLNLSLAFANRNPKADNVNETRKPILYLRSFLDDRETTFQPGTWLSNFLGVDPPYYHLSKYMFVPDEWFYRIEKKVLKYLYNNHPVRMLRLLLGWPVDTSEQQLELYFRKKGPFVAIGKPGERVITSGAERMYVSNEEWQAVILDYLHKSQLVVLQPSSTEGIWWEINQSLNLVEPERFFLCMVNYKGHQNFYEDFRLRIENIKGEIKLPRFIGNTKEICFFRFNGDWTPELHRLQYKNFIYWPFQGNAADLKRSLGV